MSAAFGPYPVTLSQQERWPIGINFIRSIPDGVTIDAVTVTWTDADTGAILSTWQDGSAIIDGTYVYAYKGANRGTPDQVAYVTFVATLSDGAKVGGDGYGTIKLIIASNN